MACLLKGLFEREEGELWIILGRPCWRDNGEQIAQLALTDNVKNLWK